jgi:hypothetical protein
MRVDVVNLMGLHGRRAQGRPYCASLQIAHQSS